VTFRFEFQSLLLFWSSFIPPSSYPFSSPESQKKEKAKRFARLTGKSGSVIRLSVFFQILLNVSCGLF
ncbi:hypothetical protein MKW98_017233, partial [Papaver atlanticum]